MVNTKNMIADTMKDSEFWNIHDDLKGKSLTELKKAQKKVTLPYSVCVLNLTGDLNVGMIARTACIFGAQEVIIFGRRKYDKRSTVGAQNYIPVTRVDGFKEHSKLVLSFDKFKAMCREKNLFPIYVEQGGQDITSITWLQWLDALYSTVDDNGKEIPLRTPCLVFGNENEGIPPEFFQIGTAISIEQRGVLRSLNVSAAAAIAIHHFSEAIALCEHAMADIKKNRK